MIWVLKGFVYCSNVYLYIQKSINKQGFFSYSQRNCAARRYLPLGARCATVFSQKVPKLGAKIFKTLIKSRSFQISSWNILWVLWGPMRTQPWKKIRQKFSSKFFVKKIFFSSNHFQISQGAYTKKLSKIGRLNPKLFAKNCPIWHLRGDIFGLHNLFDLIKIFVTKYYFVLSR